MGDQFSFSLTGEKEIQEALRALPEKMQLHAIQPGVRKAQAVIAKAMKGGAPARSGLLRTSIGVSSAKIYPRKQIVYGAAGPKRGFKRMMHTAIGDTGQGTRGRVYRTKLKKKDFMAAEVGMANPVKYAHLVERGRKAARPTKKKAMVDSTRGYPVFMKRSRGVAGRPFMARALASSRAAAFEALRAGIQDGLAKQLTKLTK